MLLVLAYELGLFNFSRGKQDPEAPGERRYLVILRLVDELGRMIGGWLKVEFQVPGTPQPALNESDAQAQPAVGAVVA